jgi:O-antigen ligase
MQPRLAETPAWSPPRTSPVLDPNETSGLRGIAFAAGLAMIFARFAILPELIVTVLHADLYVLYLIGPPALVGVLLTGGLQRTYRGLPAKLWTAFFIWMALAVPTSSWAGASATKTLGYLRTDFICLFVLAGLAVSWKDVRRIFYTIAAAGVVNLLTARFLAKPDVNGRLELDLGFDGVMSNSNDLAAQMILILPFFLYFVIKPKTNQLVRVAAFGGILYSIYVILATSSRGALLGLFAIAAYLFFRANGAQRIAVLVIVPILAVAFLAFLPKMNLARLGTLFGKEAVGEGVGGLDEAGESMASREELLRKSIQYTIEHPIFGIGPSQFENFEGISSRKLGQHGNWHATHNSWTQISSECGIPALLFFVGAFISSYRLVNKSYLAARRQQNSEVAQTCLCYLVALIGYLVTITFLAHAYHFVLPALVGLSIPLHLQAQKQLASDAAWR